MPDVSQLEYRHADKTLFNRGLTTVSFHAGSSSFYGILLPSYWAVLFVSWSVSQVFPPEFLSFPNLSVPDYPLFCLVQVVRMINTQLSINMNLLKLCGKLL